MKTNKLAKIVVVPLVALASCSAPKYTTSIEDALNERQYSMTQKILKKENKKLDRLEKKYNRFFEERTIEPTKFIKAMQKYEVQKSKVEMYEDILELSK